MKIIDKIYNKWRCIRFRPIRVFCLHHVCKRFDEKSMNKCDWLQIDEFKHKIKELKNNGYIFISLHDCYLKLSHDLFRMKKYAVITFDDGYYSLKEILPWLIDNKIPVTLFVNGKYLDGKSYRCTSLERYLTKDYIFLCNSLYVEIGHHGWEHKNCLSMDMNELKKSVCNNINVLKNHPRLVPFWAYTWGRHNDTTDDVLKEYNLTPVLMDGLKNFNDNQCIHRELI